MFKNAIEVVQIFGFKIRVDPSWFLIAALVVWGLSSTHFPIELPGYSNRSYVLFSTVAMLGLFASVILHELAHSLMARRFGLNVGSIILFIFGGVAELETEPRDPVSEFWIAIAGPVMSVLLAGLAYLMIANFGSSSGSRPLGAILKYLWQINLLLAVFNMVPAFPLDGGRIFRAALWAFKKDLLFATRIASRFGLVFGAFLILAGVLGLVLQIGVGGFWYIIIGFFIVSASQNSYRSLINKRALQGQTVEHLMTHNPTTVTPGQQISDVVQNVMLPNNISFLPVQESDHLLGYIDLQMVNKIDREKWNDVTVAQVYKPKSADSTIAATTALQDVLKKMSETGKRKQMITDGQALTGIVSLADLLNYLELRTNLDQLSNGRAGHTGSSR